MKIFALTSVFLFVFFAFGNGQDTVNANPLEGVWQMYVPQGGNPVIENQETGELSIDSGKLKPTNFYKFFCKNGDFLALVATPVVSKLTITGTYEVLSPDSYVEHVKEHSNPAYAHRDTELKYRFIGNDVFIMSYVNQLGGISIEIWIKVKFDKHMDGSIQQG